MTRSFIKTTSFWLLVGAICLSHSAWVTPAVAQPLAQNQAPWYFHPRSMPPGVVGANQLLTGMPLRGYYQPVQIQAPKGVEVSFAIDGKFERPRVSAKAALLVGNVYRLRVRGLANFPEASVYPTIELVNRLYPPAGQAWKFPIPIYFTLDDLESALQGRLVTRVVYVENPRQALAVQSPVGRQTSFDVDQRTDPLRTADRLGRPIAIIRLGSRTPTANGMKGFMYGNPPVMLPAEESNSGRQAFNIIRTPAVRRDDTGVAHETQRIRR